MLSTLLLSLLLLLSPTTDRVDSIPNIHNSGNAQEGIEEIVSVLDIDEESASDIIEQLTALADNPQNINTATYDDLIAIPLITESHALAIISHRYLYGDMHSIAELHLIPDLSPPIRNLLSLLYYAKPIPRDSKKHDNPWGIDNEDEKKKGNKGGNRNSHYTKTKAEHPHNSLTANVSVPLYQREGYTDGTYRGPSVSHALRYSYNSAHLQMAFTAAQDAGEPFFAGTNKKGWDFYTGYIRLKNKGALRDMMSGRCQVSNIVLGRYQVSNGMGLIINTGWRPFRTALLTGSPSVGTNIRGHASRQQSNYLQGAAATLALSSRLTLSAFFSYRKIDAKLSSTDSIDTSTTDSPITSPIGITTIQTSGYHRTDSEINNRNTSGQLAAGVLLGYTTRSVLVPHDRLYLSLAAQYVRYDNPLTPDISQLYKRYALNGKDFPSASLSYSYTQRRLQFSGETAISESSAGRGIALATANSMRYVLLPDVSLFALHRFYSYMFQSPLGKSFGDVSNVQDENGLYVGFNAKATSRLTISGYTDVAHHPWPRYGYKTASKSIDAVLTAAYAINHSTMNMRYRYQDKHGVGAASDGQHSLRFILRHRNGQCTFDSQVQGTLLPHSAHWGYLAQQGMTCHLGGGGKKASRHQGIELSGTATYFYTDDYASRLYTAERSPAFTSLVNMLYGRGMRLSVFSTYMPLPSLAVSLQYTALRYFDRTVISSSHQQINAPYRQDMGVVIKWKF